MISFQKCSSSSYRARVLPHATGRRIAPYVWPNRAELKILAGTRWLCGQGNLFQETPGREMPVPFRLSTARQKKVVHGLTRLRVSAERPFHAEGIPYSST